MCILFINTDPDPPIGGYRLIIASNRDEYYKRPAKNAFLCPETQIIGGRDMTDGREGGMWLGVAVKPSKLSFAALLNVTGEEKKTDHVLGRGPIVYNYLKDAIITPVKYFDSLSPPKNYNAFNVVIVDVSKTTSDLVCYHHSNTPQKNYEYPGKRVLAFGNSTPDSPLTKVTKGKARFEEIISKNYGNKEKLIEGLLGLLKSKERNLPDLELERRAPFAFEDLSSICVEIAEGYGTRTHSIVLVDRDYNLEFIEHTMREPIDISNPKWDVNVIKSRL